MGFINEVTGVTLAIDTAIESGSVAVFRQGVLVDSRTGRAGASRAEEILQVISEILTSNGIKSNEIANIIVSSGPGSFTGVRIGMAIVKGMCEAFGCKSLAVSALEALALTFAKNGRVITAVPAGRGSVAWQCFELDKAGASAYGEIRTGKSDEFLAAAAAEETEFIIAHSFVLRETGQAGDAKFVDAGECMAEHLGIAALRWGGDETLTPVYAYGSRYEAA